MKRQLLIFSLIILSFSTEGMAQATASFTASVTIIQPIGILNTANMNFANVDARSRGAIILSPDNSRISQGGVELTDGNTVSAATFEVTGQAGYTYSITLPNSEHVLTNGIDDIIIRDFTSSLKDEGSLDSGSQTLRIGASLDINPNQAPGNYTSPAGFNVCVNYN
jgi:hypothetical protein